MSVAQYEGLDYLLSYHRGAKASQRLGLSYGYSQPHVAEPLMTFKWGAWRWLVRSNITLGRLRTIQRAIEANRIWVEHSTARPWLRINGANPIKYRIYRAGRA